MTTEYESEYQLPDEDTEQDNEVEQGKANRHDEDAVARFERQRASFNSGVRARNSANHNRAQARSEQELDLENERTKGSSKYGLIAIIFVVVCIAVTVMWFVIRPQSTQGSQPQNASAELPEFILNAHHGENTMKADIKFNKVAAQAGVTEEPNTEVVDQTTMVSPDPNSLSVEEGLAPLGSDIITDPAQPVEDASHGDGAVSNSDAVALLEKERDFTQTLTANIDKLQAENNDLKNELNEQKLQNKKLLLEIETLKSTKLIEANVTPVKPRALPNMYVATVVKSGNTPIAMIQRNNGEAFTATVGQMVATESGKQIVKSIDADAKRVIFESGMYVEQTTPNTPKELTQTKRAAKLQSSESKPTTQLYEVSGWTWISQAKAADGTRTVIVMPPNGQPIRVVVNTDLSSYGAGVVTEINVRGDVVFRNGAVIKNPFHN